MEEEKSAGQSSGTGMGVGALVTAIIAFLLAVIPCVGLVAVIPAVIAIVLAIIGLSRPQVNQGMLVGGLVVGIIALMISASQIFVLGKIAEKSGSWATNIEKVIRNVADDIEDEFGDQEVTIKINKDDETIRNVADDIEDEFGDQEVTIKINKDDETVEIKSSGKRGDLEERLEELEGSVDTLKSRSDTTKGEW